MKHKLAAAAALAAFLLAAPVRATSDGMVAVPPADTPIPDLLREPVEMILRGVVTYEDLEGGFYAVSGWMLMGDQEQFQKLLGQEVVVIGTPFYGATIQQVPAIKVREIRPAGDEDVIVKPVLPIMPPIDDWPWIPLTPVGIWNTLPTAITVNGEAITFDQEPVLQDGVLMVPLRRIVEAAGGSITWHGDNQTIVARLGRRTMHFQVGLDEAELNETGVYYIRPNILKLARPVTILNGRTLVSSEVLGLLGLGDRDGEDQRLDLYLIRLNRLKWPPIADPIPIDPPILPEAEQPPEVLDAGT